MIVFSFLYHCWNSIELNPNSLQHDSLKVGLRPELATSTKVFSTLWPFTLMAWWQWWLGIDLGNGFDMGINLGLSGHRSVFTFIWKTICSDSDAIVLHNVLNSEGQQTSQKLCFEIGGKSWKSMVPCQKTASPSPGQVMAKIRVRIVGKGHWE